MTRYCLQLIALTVCISMSSRVQAQRDIELQTPANAAATSKSSPTKRLPKQQSYRSEWYGGYTLAVDAVGILTIPLIAGIGIYALGAPIVHLAEGETGHAAWSLGLRLGLPTVLGLAGAGIGAAAFNNDCDRSSLSGDYCGAAPALLGVGGVILGMAGAITIDAAVLARHRVPAAPLESAGIRLVPDLALAHNRAALGVGGTF